MPKPLWTCPRCGRTLVVPNQEHVCGLHDLESHFERKDPIGKKAFDWMSDLFGMLGPHDILPMKTTIAFASGVNLAFLTTKRKGAEISIVMNGTVSSPRFCAEVPYSRTKRICRLRIYDESELDSELADWLKRAYEDGAR